MRINRRQLLRGILGAGGAASGALVISTVAQEYPAHPLAPPEDDGVPGGKLPRQRKPPSKGRNQRSSRKKRAVFQEDGL